MGGGGVAGEVEKKYLRKGKLNEKNSCTPIDSKKYSYKEFDSRPLPPHNFSNGPSLRNDNEAFGRGDVMKISNYWLVTV